MNTTQKTGILLIAILSMSIMQAQRKNKGSDFKTEMTQHYKAYHKMMLESGSINGAIESLNHLLILDPSQGKKDTLSALYLQNNKPFLAIKNAEKSNTILALRTKAIAFKQVKNIKKAIENYELIIAQTNSVLDIYELAQLQFGLQRYAEAKASVQVAFQNAKDEKVKIFVKEQNYIETPIKAALLNILGLIEYNLNTSEPQKAIAYFDEAIKLDPNCILAIENKKAIMSKK